MRAQQFLLRYGDALLGVTLAGLLALQLWLDAEAGPEERIAASFVLAVLAALLAARVRLPLVLLGLMAAAAIASTWWAEASDYEATGLIVLLAVYTAAAHTGGTRAWVAGALTAVLGAFVAANDPEELNLGGAVFFALLFGAPWVTGRAIRRRRLREVRLEEEKEAAEAAIVAERARIARELHDVVAHAISVIVLQARGGRRLLETEPAETRAALDTIERTAAQALVEMRRLLGLLRTDEHLALAPQPSLARIDALAAELTRSGLPVEVRVEGEATDLPPGVDLSAYRIVQEALTNALKHAGPARVVVSLRYGEGELDLEVADNGAGVGNGTGTGHGLVGIRERVAVYGGDFAAGRRPGGGYAVRARLPYSTEP